MKNVAILLAGGNGSRLGNDIPKQYVEVNGKPVIAWSMSTLSNHHLIDGIWIVAHSEWHEYIRNNVDCTKLAGFAKPGHNRQLSIWNALNEIEEYFQDENGGQFGTRQPIVGNVWTKAGKSGDDDTNEERSDNTTVLIHDAARPFLTAGMLDDIYAAMEGCDGVMPVLPVKDTLYVSSDGTAIESLLDRNRIFAGQAPECFDFFKYFKANEELLPDRIMNINGSSQPAVMAGMNIRMITGDENNFKITTGADMEKFMISVGC